MSEAEPILKSLGAGIAVKKLVETSIGLNNSRDPIQRNHAYSFMESALRELEGNLKNHNIGSRTTGSEQSTQNSGMYTLVGNMSKNGQRGMFGMENTENQMRLMKSYTRKAINNYHETAIKPKIKIIKSNDSLIKEQEKALAHLQKEADDLNNDEKSLGLKIGGLDLGENNQPLIPDTNTGKTLEQIQSDIFLEDQNLNSKDSIYR